jgi:hypothetical protein
LKSQISLPPCHGCQLGRSHERPLGPSDKHSARILGLVHTDLTELPTESHTPAHWILTFIDNCSAFASLAFLHRKSDTALWFRELVLHAETLTGLSVTSVRLDHGGKYLGQDLLQFFTSKGISCQYSVPHLPQQNGRAERFNRTIMEKAQAICLNACLPNSFWQDACETALHIYNRQPMHHHSWKTPAAIFLGKKPDISYFRVFGCKAYVFILKDIRQNKLSPKAEEMIFIGYEQESKHIAFTVQHVDEFLSPRQLLSMKEISIIAQRK